VFDDATSLDPAALRARVVALEAQLVATKREADEYRDERDRLREAYRHLQLELELQRRRLFVAKAERIDTAQLDLEFAATLAKLEEVAGLLGENAVAPGDAPTTPAEPKRRPTGRRTLRDLELPEERIVVVDPLFDGRAERIGADETCQLAWRRGGMVRLVTVRIKYHPAGMSTAADSDPTIVIAPLPPQILPRSIAGPSLLAHIASDKFCDGLPLYRQEDRFKRLGAPIDRGSMSRWLEELGAIMGGSIVHAMRTDAFAHAFCLATDATGVLVQPLRDGATTRRACRRAHFFVQLADADHVFFEYTPKETSAVVGELFRGFAGYVQADAKSVYDVLFRPPDQRGPLDDDEVDRAVRLEVGCWSHYPEPSVIWSRRPEWAA
jgi:transposase